MIGRNAGSAVSTYQKSASDGDMRWGNRYGGRSSLGRFIGGPTAEKDSGSGGRHPAPGARRYCAGFSARLCRAGRFGGCRPPGGKHPLAPQRYDFRFARVNRFPTFMTGRKSRPSRAATGVATFRAIPSAYRASERVVVVVVSMGSWVGSGRRTVVPDRDVHIARRSPCTVRRAVFDAYDT